MENTDIETLTAKLAESGLASQFADKLETLAESAYCIHHSWGLGEIKSYSAAENRLIVDFPEAGKINHKMAPEFCLGKCEILRKNHILARFKKDPSQVLDWAKNNRVELVKQILASSDFAKLIDTQNHIKYIPKKDLVETLAKIDETNRPTVTSIMAGSEIEAVLIHILGAEDYKKWWSAAKKELQKNEYIGVPAKKDGYYELREEGQAVSPEEVILEEYFREKKPHNKIDLVVKLFAFSSKEELPKVLPGMPQPLFSYNTSNPAVKAKLHDIFEELTETLKDTRRLKAADRLFGVWVRNDLCRCLREEVDLLEPTSTSIIKAEQEQGKLAELAKQLPQDLKFLKRLLDLLSRIYEEPAAGETEPEWVDIIVDLMRNSVGKFTAECILFLHEHKKADLVYKTLKNWLDNQTLSSSLLIWIIKNRGTPKYTEGLKPLITHRLLSAIFHAIDKEGIASNSAKKIQLAEEVRHDAELINDLLEDADENIARDLAQQLKTIQGYSDLARKSIFSRFIKVYPSIQSLIEGQGSTKSDTLYVSKESYEAKQAELNEIINVKLPAVEKAITAAKELGDLSENSEYKMARQDQATLSALREKIQKELANAQITDFSSATTDKISIGSIVKIQSASGKINVYTILGAWDSNTDKNILSYNTGLAQKLIGKKVGDELTFDRENWKITEFIRWVDKTEDVQ